MLSWTRPSPRLLLLGAAALLLVLLTLATLFSRYLTTNLSQSLTDGHEALIGGELAGDTLSAGEHTVTFRGKTQKGIVVTDTAQLVVGDTTPSPSPPPHFSPPGFKDLGSHVGRGAIMAQVVGPGPTPNSERFYVSYAYFRGATDIVAIDPETGAYDVYTIPLSATVRALTVGLDNKIYIGTYPSSGGAKFYRIDPASKTLTELGRPSPTETVIWQLAVGTDGKIYGGTYPQARLVRYDPATNTLADLGRLHATEKYARYVAADAHGFVYVMVGLVQYHLMAYEISSGKQVNILPAAYRTPDWVISSLVKRGTAGDVYALISNRTNPSQPAQWLRLHQGIATPVATNALPPAVPSTRLKDGRVITSVFDGKIKIKNLNGTITERPYDYRGKEMGLFRLGLGPNNMVYGSTAFPASLVRLDPFSGQLTRIDTEAVPLGGGEVYSFLPYQDMIYVAAYGAQAPLMVHDPSRAYVPGKGPDANPYRVPSLPEIKSSWRAMAMLRLGEKIYIGSVPEYGKLGGYLTVVDPATRQMQSTHQVIPNQSVFALTAWNDQLVGGTNIIGGGGTNPTTTEARLFLWNPATQQKTFDLVPVPGAASINNLVTTPAGKVIGTARKPGAKADILFVFDPATRTVLHTASLPVGMFTPSEGSSQGMGADGLIYGIYRAGVYTINPTTYEVRTAATYAPSPGAKITSGFAMLGNSLFFSAAARIGQWVMP